MSDEAAFIPGIREHPLDDLRRLVYADWLDERGRSEQAEYLRLVAALAAPGTAVDVEHPHAVRLVELVTVLEPTWREAVGSRFDLWLDGYELPQKINVIRRVRDVSGCGIAEALEFSKSLPKVLPEVATFDEAVVAFAIFRTLTVRQRIVPTTSTGASRLRPRNVALEWESWMLDGVPMCSPEHVRAALGHMRRILTADPELAERAADVPESLETGATKFSLVIGTTRFHRDWEVWSQRLFQTRTFTGRHVDPPFYGVLRVKITSS
jgi:uncharacterized protein (TIGR02996 family)